MHLYSFTLPQDHRELLSEMLAEQILHARIKKADCESAGDGDECSRLDKMEFMRRYFCQPDNLLVVLYNEESQEDYHKNHEQPSAWNTVNLATQAPIRRHFPRKRPRPS